MAIQGFFTGDVKIRDLNGVLKAVDGIVEVATDAGTVTSVGLTVGSTGTDVNVANSPITTSGSITLNLPTASATNRGLLSSADWAIFSAKQGAITLTTTGNNGSATLISGTLNIPTYTLAGLGGISLTSLSASSPLAYNNTTGAFSIQVANGSQNGYLSSTDWTTFNSKQSALTFSAPLVNTSGTISIPAATSSVNGYLTSTDWSTFNSKQGTITLTTTGSSGAATLVGVTLNIPTYTLSGLGGVPTSRQLTINGTAYDLSADRSWSVGTVTSVGLTMPSAFAVSSSPVTGSGTISVTGAGNATQYIRGDGALATFPTNGGGGGASVSYYLNGSVNQGTFGGNTYYEMNKTPIIGAGTDFTINADGYIAQFITDANDPALLKIPAGNWNFETYFQASSGGGSPTFYIELYKYNGTTFTLIASNSGNPKLINDGTNIEAYFTALAVPETVLTLTDRIAIRIYVTHSGRTITLHTENSHLCQIITTFTTGLAALNGLTEQVQYLATGTSGTDFNISSVTATHTFNLPTASATNRGALSSTDWNTFYNKQAAGSYITALTGEATASGPGSATVTLSTSAVTGKLLTGLNLTGGGSIAATDSILQAFGKVQNQISGLAGGVTYQGTWNASTNTPTLTSSVGTKGYYYIVDVAGSTNLNGITDWKIGDWAIFNGSTWDKVDNTDAVSSVNGFTGAVSLTTSNIAEGTNLYYLDSRARLALSFTAGSGAYNNTTGVITIPTNTSQLTNGANFITLSSLSASSPLSYNSGTGAFSIQVANSFQNGYLSSTDWNTFNSKQNTITLTTTGSSGSSTLVGATLNVPTYTLSGLGGVPTSRQLTINGTAYDLSADRSWSVGTVTGSGTTGYVSKWSSSTAISNSLLYDNGSAVLIGTQTASTAKFMVYSSAGDNHYQAIGTAPSFRFADTITSPTYTGVIGLATGSNQFVTGSAAGDMVLSSNTSSAGNFLFGTAATERMRINATTGNVSIGGTGNTYKLDVSGTGRFTGQLDVNANIIVNSGSDNGYLVTDGTNYSYFSQARSSNSYISGSAIGDAIIRGKNGVAIGGNNGDGSGLRIASTGAATFSSSITTGDYIRLPLDTYLQSSDGSGGWIELIKGSGINTVVNNNKNGAIIFNQSSGGGEKMRITSGGNVGIGTTSPTYPLTVISNSSTQGFRLAGRSSDNIANISFTSNDQATEYAFMNTAATYLAIGTNGSERMRITSGGNVGIGTTSPAYKLQVSSTVAEVMRLQGMVGNVSSNNTQLRFFGSASNTDLWAIGTEVSTGTSDRAFDFYDLVAGANRMRITSGGNVGIGTTSPNDYSIGSTAKVLQVTGSSYGIINANAGSVYAWLIADTTAAATGTFSNHDFKIVTNNTERMRITSGGNVGIGTSSPSRFVSIQTSGSADIALQIRNTGTSTGSHSALHLGIDGSVTNAGGIAALCSTFSNSGLLYAGGTYIYNNQSTGGITINSEASAPIYFGTNNTERMRITSGGNVGIGTTPASWLTSTITPLQVRNSSFAGYSTSGVHITYVGSNWYYDTGGTDRYISNGNASIFTQANGDFNFVTSASGTGGNAISFSQVFKIRNDAAIFSPGVYNFTTGSGANVVVFSDGSMQRSTSSLKYKKNVENYTKGLAEVMQMRPVTYNSKNEKETQTFAGLIAEEVHALGLTEFVQYANDGTPDALSYQNMVALLIKGMQELKAELDTLKNK